MIMVMIILGLILVVFGLASFYFEYKKTPQELEFQKNESKLTDKEEKWRRNSVLSRSLGTAFIGILMILMGIK